MTTIRIGGIATVTIPTYDEKKKYYIHNLLKVKGETPVIGCSDTVKCFTGVAPTSVGGTILIWRCGSQGDAGSVRYYQQPIVTTSNVYVVKPWGELLPLYLYFLIKQEEDEIKKKAEATTQTKMVLLGTIVDAIGNLEDKILPLPEQERICGLYRLMLRYEQLSKQECTLIRRIRREIIKDQISKY